jgi:hypothetical protein
MRPPLYPLILLFGCAGPLEAVETAREGLVALSLCGSSSVSLARMIETADTPGDHPEAGALLPAPVELHLCVRAQNRGPRPVTIDRSRLHLQTPEGRQTWIPDADPEEVQVPAGGERALRVGFSAAPLPVGTRVSLVADGAVHPGPAPAPLVLRKRR